MHRTDSPSAILVRFLKFGALAWGGPAAQIAMIKHGKLTVLYVVLGAGAIAALLQATGVS